MIPAHIADNSLSFFARGRMYDVPSDHPNFVGIRNNLVENISFSDSEIDGLISMADPRIALQQAGLTIEGNSVQYGGQDLHNVWVDKILLFQSQQIPFDPIFKALENLLTNPTPEAIERLPLFVEQSKLGFLPDGRIAAFKVVRSNFHDVRTGTFDNSPGMIVSMDRSEVNADPNATCSTGLHVGALPYITQGDYSFNAMRDDRKVVLVAVWPSDFVAVPRDYSGSKARVCSYEVIQEVDAQFINEFVGLNNTVVASRELPAWQRAQVGDWVQIDSLVSHLSGVFEVVDINTSPNTNARLITRMSDGRHVPRSNECVSEIVPAPPAWQRARVGDTVVLDNGTACDVVQIDDDAQSEQRLKLGFDDGSRAWIMNVRIEDIIR